MAEEKNPLSNDNSDFPSLLADYLAARECGSFLFLTACPESEFSGGFLGDLRDGLHG